MFYHVYGFTYLRTLESKIYKIEYIKISIFSLFSHVFKITSLIEEQLFLHFQNYNFYLMVNW